MYLVLVAALLVFQWSLVIYLGFDALRTARRGTIACRQSEEGEKSCFLSIIGRTAAS